MWQDEALDRFRIWHAACGSKGRRWSEAQRRPTGIRLPDDKGGAALKGKSTSPNELLLVGDDPERLDALDARLKGFAPSMRTVTLDAAREELCGEQVHCAVVALDVRATQLLCELSSPMEAAPIVAVAAKDQLELVDTILAAGVAEIAFEPVGAAELELRVRKAIADRALQAQRARAAEVELAQAVAELEQSRHQVVQAQRMESVGRLAGGIAHDFNNLLTSIISFSRFVLDDLAPGDPRRADLVEVLKAADSASRLTSQLLAFSRRRKVEPTVVDLRDAVENIGRVLRRTVGQDVEVVILLPDTPLSVVVDRGQLDQVIMNLAVNARDAMVGGGTLTLSLERTSIERHSELPDGEYVLLKVADTGEGMEPHIVQHVFEPFFSTKGDKGTGLGLATAYGIVKQANGHVDVKSKPGAGTVFTIMLPRVSQQPSEHDSEILATAIPKGVRGGLALVVDDQPAIIKTVERALTEVGFNVLHAQSAEEAIVMIEELNPRLELLVTDVMLPGLNGTRLAHKLRERQPGLRVVICSGYVGEDDVSDLPSDDCTVFLPKPFTGAQLVSRAAQLFS